MKSLYPAWYVSKGSTSTCSKILSESHGAKISLFRGGTGIHQNQKGGGEQGVPKVVQDDRISRKWFKKKWGIEAFLRKIF